MAKKMLWEIDAREDDGTVNNLNHDTWGAASSSLVRGGYAAIYGDGNAATLSDNMAPRAYPQPLGLLTDPAKHIDLIKDVVRTETNTPNKFGVNELHAYYGQFIAHDMVSSAVPIPITEREKLFPSASTDPSAPDFALSNITRSVRDADGNQVNAVTSFLDLSAVYGSGEQISLAAGGTTSLSTMLRGSGADPIINAKLIEGTKSALPSLAQVLAAHLEANSQSLSPALGVFTGNTNQLVGGDIRAAQTPMLAAIQGVWLREHNFQVDQIASKHPGLSGDQLFQAARTITEAEHQHVIYNEYLSSVIGRENIPRYKGYDPAGNPGVINAFTTVAFRFGHSQQSAFVPLKDAEGRQIDALDLGTAFLSTSRVLQSEGGLENLLRGLQTQKSQAIDIKVSAGLVDDALKIPGLNLNLALLDNLRATDHGIGTLNQLREQMGLPKHESFAALTRDVALQEKLAAYYGHIDNVDPWIGGLIETPARNSQLGQTFTRLIAEQFSHTRASDRFYYEHHLRESPELIAEIRGTSFAEISDRVTGTSHSHLNSFHVAKETIGTDTNNTLRGRDEIGLQKADLLIGKAGDDVLDGRDGSDSLYGDDGKDRLMGGGGNDFIKGGAGSDTILGGAGDDKAWGDDGDDLIILEAGNDWAVGGAGMDFIDGREGNDTILGQAGDDRLFGGAGSDQIFGGEGRDEIKGGSENDHLFGGAGNDAIFGENGDDRLMGDIGDDILWGGLGRDIFSFTPGSGRDRICDFDFRQDKIEFHRMQALDTYAEVRAAIRPGPGGSHMLMLGDTNGDGVSESITLIGIGPGLLAEGHFIFS